MPLEKQAHSVEKRIENEKGKSIPYMVSPSGAEVERYKEQLMKDPKFMQVSQEVPLMVTA